MNHIIAALKADPRRDIYESGDRRGDYWISYQGGGPFPRVQVLSLFEQGILKRKYPNCECYALAEAGRTGN